MEKKSGLTRGTALIFGAVPVSDWSYLRRICACPDLVIAADGGVKCARAAGYRPDLLVGDWDSGGAPEDGILSISLPPEKDLTDLQAAAQEALARGCTELYFTACLGGRLDQTMANLCLTEWVYEHGGRAFVVDEGNLAVFWDGSPIRLQKDAFYSYLSILPLDQMVRGVTLQGVRYPLVGANLTRGDTLTISNEVTASEAVLWAERGRMLVVRGRRSIYF